ncbi:MAG: hypothetical protein D6781_08095, partial [Verrucomicrobia bacterium]
APRHPFPPSALRDQGQRLARHLTHTLPGEVVVSVDFSVLPEASRADTPTTVLAIHTNAAVPADCSWRICYVAAAAGGFESTGWMEARLDFTRLPAISPHTAELLKRRIQAHRWPGFVVETGESSVSIGQAFDWPPPPRRLAATIAPQLSRLITQLHALLVEVFGQAGSPHGGRGDDGLVVPGSLAPAAGDEEVA